MFKELPKYLSYFFLFFFPIPIAEQTQTKISTNERFLLSPSLTPSQESDPAGSAILRS